MSSLNDIAALANHRAVSTALVNTPTPASNNYSVPKGNAIAVMDCMPNCKSHWNSSWWPAISNPSNAFIDGILWAEVLPNRSQAHPTTPSTNPAGKDYGKWKLPEFRWRIALECITVFIYKVCWPSQLNWSAWFCPSTASWGFIFFHHTTSLHDLK